MARIFGGKKGKDSEIDEETTPVERPSSVVPESSAPTRSSTPTPPTGPMVNWRATLEGVAKAIEGNKPALSRRLMRIAKKV